MKDVIMINQNRMFKRVYYKGKSLVSPVLVTYILKNYNNKKRLGITASKKIGKAVNRNRCRRIIKEAFRKINFHVDTGYDIVFVARHKTNLVKMNSVMKDMIFHIKKSGIWR